MHALPEELGFSLWLQHQTHTHAFQMGGTYSSSRPTHIEVAYHHRHQLPHVQHTRALLYHLIPSISHAPVSLPFLPYDRHFVPSSKTMAVWKQIVCLVAAISSVQAFLPGQTRYASDLVRGMEQHERGVTTRVGSFECVYVLV